MCYGYDGNSALDRSLAERGVQRRTVLRGSLAAAAGAGLVAAGVAGAVPAVADGRHDHDHDHGRGRGRRRSVPKDDISIQLWTVRDDLSGDGAPGYDATLQAIADFGYPKVELALGYFGRTAAQLREFYDSIGVRPTSSHDGISADQASLDAKIENALTLGQKYIVVPFLDSSSADEWRTWAEQMNEEAELARSAGLRYGYHNHAHEFTTDLGGGLRPWDILTGELDKRLVHLEIDIYWAVTGGINSGEGVDDPEGFTLDVIRAARQRVRQYHVKDRDPATGDMADLGTGMIDFGRIFDKHQAEEYIVENDTPDVTPLNTAEVGYNYLRRLRF